MASKRTLPPESTPMAWIRPYVRQWGDERRPPGALPRGVCSTISLSISPKARVPLRWAPSAGTPDPETSSRSPRSPRFPDCRRATSGGCSACSSAARRVHSSGARASPRRSSSCSARRSMSRRYRRWSASRPFTASRGPSRPSRAFRRRGTAPRQREQRRVRRERIGSSTDTACAHTCGYASAGTSTHAFFSDEAIASSASCTPFAPSSRLQRNGSSRTTCLRNSSH
jgi:hypothetical protein